MPVVRKGFFGPTKLPHSVDTMPQLHFGEINQAQHRRTQAAVAGGTAISVGATTRKRKEKPVSKSLGRDTTVAKMYDPFAEEEVTVSKELVITGTKTIGALIPTGPHVSHANRLTHITNSKGKGGKADHLLKVTKADEPKASGGRYAAGTAFGGYHALAAGKKGKKAQAFGSSVWHSAAGGAPGNAALHAGLRSGNKALTAGGAVGVIAGGLGGSHRAVTINQRKGRYKPEQS